MNLLRYALVAATLFCLGLNLYVGVTFRASLDGPDQGEFTEGHELPARWKLPKAIIGRRLSQEEAKRLLAKFGPSASE